LQTRESVLKDYLLSLEGPTTWILYQSGDKNMVWIQSISQ
jgi:hypothetical protein